MGLINDHQALTEMTIRDESLINLRAENIRHFGRKLGVSLFGHPVRRVVLSWSQLDVYGVRHQADWLFVCL